MGVGEAVSLMEEGMDLAYAMEHAEEILYKKTRQAVLDWFKPTQPA